MFVASGLQERETAGAIFLLDLVLVLFYIAIMPLSNVVTIKRRQNRARIVDDLRRMLPRLEVLPTKVLPFDVSTLDDCFPQGGLAFGALHEVAPESAHDIPAAFGFVTVLLARMPNGPVLLVTSPRGLGSCGCLHGHGLNALGLDPARMILVEAGDERQALWAMEEALRSGAPAAVAGAIGKGLDLKASQRLQLAARTSGLPLLLLRPGGTLGLSAAMTRWRIRAVEAARDSFGLIARRISGGDDRRVRRRHLSAARLGLGLRVE
jgi:protein ImuA